MTKSDGCVWAATIRAVRHRNPNTAIEVLTPDFRGQEMPLAKVIAERPDVFNHNVEVVPRLYPMARRGSRFERSARVLRMAKEMGGGEVITKSGLMVGLGESRDEVVEVLADLRDAGCQVVTIGQYLRPTPQQVPVERYWTPEEFAELDAAGTALGLEVFAGPFVRSSYRAEEAFLKVVGQG